jgi:predicted O-methyltransferase YrrM
MNGFSRVLEIGTEYGRSAMAMADGMGTRIDTLTTVDIADHAEARLLDGRKGVHRVIGDAMLPPVMQRVLQLFDYKPIDVLFVDSGHDYPTTMAHMGTYGALLQPKIIVIDDIVLNEDMARFWADVRKLYGARAVNACDVDPRVRSGDCGFGVILLQ